MNVSRNRIGRLIGVAVIVLAMPMATVSPLTAANPDADAGAWRMIVLSGPNQIAVPSPSQVGGLDYQAELTAIKSAQGRLTKEQRQAIDYWSRGGVLRWNEIMLELVARVDLPPAPSPDGTYSVPDANNHSPTLNSPSAIRPTPRGRTATSRWRSSRR